MALFTPAWSWYLFATEGNRFKATRAQIVLILNEYIQSAPFNCMPPGFSKIPSLFKKAPLNI